MTNFEQDLIQIAIVSTALLVVILIGIFLTNNRRLRRIEKKIDALKRDDDPSTGITRDR